MLITIANAANFFGWDRFPVLVVAVFESVLLVGGLGVWWWFVGRDRWLGEDYYQTGKTTERIKPLFAHETIVPEYEPPKLPGTGHVLRPAEMSALVHERVDSDDISATFIDLAVRRYIRIEEVGAGEASGPDYVLTRLRESDADLQEYEQRLITAVFAHCDEGPDPQPTVSLSGLRGAFWLEMASIRQSLYTDVVSTERLFAIDPDAARAGSLWAFSPTLALFSLLAIVALGAEHGVALLAAPPLVGSLGGFLLSRAMPRRTGIGREMLRRSAGFRLFLLTAQEDELKFADAEGILERYLPYAMIFRCAKQWSERFGGLDSIKQMPDWYLAKYTRHEPIDSKVHAFAASFAVADESKTEAAHRV